MAKSEGYQRTVNELNTLGSILGLERITSLCKKLGDPQKGLKFIHVAGTNGKGSVSRMIYSVLRSGGYTVGLFTSPYLERFNERIEVDGSQIDDRSLNLLMAQVKAAIDQLVSEGQPSPTEFDAVTALAFLYFKECDVDYVVLEVGLGGRLDSTNVIDWPLCSIITNVSLDHTDVLGGTLEEIAMEKAGIIKKGSVVISGAMDNRAKEVIRQKSRSEDCKLVESDLGTIKIYAMDYKETQMEVLPVNYHSLNIKLSMAGNYQVENALTAITAISEMNNLGLIKVNDHNIIDGMAKASNAGRLETISYLGFDYILDGAHNQAGAMALCSFVRKMQDATGRTPEETVVLTGVLKDKDVHGMYKELTKMAKNFVVVDVKNPRALKKEKLKEYIESIDNEAKVYLREDVHSGLLLGRQLTESMEGESLICCGSLYLIGEVRTAVREVLIDG